MPFTTVWSLEENFSEGRDSSVEKMLDGQIEDPLREPLSKLSRELKALIVRGLSGLSRDLEEIHKEMSGITSPSLIWPEEVPGMATGGQDGANGSSVQVDEASRTEGLKERDQDTRSGEQLCLLVKEKLESDKTNQNIGSRKILESDKTSKHLSTAESHRECYYLKPVLAQFMGLDKACLSGVMQRFWSYVLTKGLIHNDDMRYCKTDEQLRALFQGSVHVHVLDSVMILSQHFGLRATVHRATHLGSQGQGEVARGFEEFQVNTP